MNRITKNTLGMFDCLKGAFLFLVILVHTYTDVLGGNAGEFSFVYKMIVNLTGLAMAVLFVVSGYGFKPIKSRKAFMNQVQMLIKPCLIVYGCCFLVRIPWNIIFHRTPFDGIKERVMGFILGMVWYGEVAGVQVYSIQILWYAIALFLDWLILSGVFYVFKKEKVRCLVIILLSVLGLFLSSVFGVMPFCIGQTLLSIGFVYFGYVLKMNNWLFRRLPIWVYGGLFAASVITLIFGDFNIGSCVAKLGAVDYICILCAALLVLRVYLYVMDPDARIYQLFLLMGKNALMILFIHGFDHLTFSWREFDDLYAGPYNIGVWMMFIVRLGITLLVAQGLQVIRKKLIQRKRRKKI